jgi:hypothetical protein
MVFIITIIIITVLQGFGISTVMMILRVNIEEYRLRLYVIKLYFTVEYQYEHVHIYLFIGPMNLSIYI